MAELFRGVGIFALYIIPGAVGALLLRRFARIPDEVFRKLLHFLMVGGYSIFLFSFRTWWVAAVFVGLLAVAFFTLFSLLGRLPGFPEFINERRAGELRVSMALALGMVALSIALCWGWLEDKLLALAALYAWGVGDGCAALVGTRFGRHKISWRLSDGKKSWEGSIAMVLTASLAVFVILWIRGGLPLGLCGLIAVAAGTAAAFAELCSRGGIDTVTCPLTALAVLLPLVKLFEQ